MSASEGDADTPIRKFQGFQTYADDTPRGAAPEAVEPEPMSWATPRAEPEAEDDADADADDPRDLGPLPGAEGPRAPRRAAPVAVVALGAALAVGAGLYVAREEPAPREPAPAAAADSPGSQMNVEVASVAETLPPPPPASASDKLDVLEPSAAVPGRDEASTIRAYPQTPAPPRSLEVSPPRPSMESPPPGPRSPRALGGAVPETRAFAPPPRPWSDCRDAPTLAVSMVCADRGLASLDQRMKQAYATALDAGVPADLLREDQADWLDVREDAAQVSRQAVADIYRQRIGELRRAARED